MEYFFGSYGFLITKELIFDFQILDLKDHFSASLINKTGKVWNKNYESPLKTPFYHSIHLFEGHCSEWVLSNDTNGSSWSCKRKPNRDQWIMSMKISWISKLSPWPWLAVLNFKANFCQHCKQETTGSTVRCYSARFSLEWQKELCSWGVQC